MTDLPERPCWRLQPHGGHVYGVWRCPGVLANPGAPHPDTERARKLERALAAVDGQRAQTTARAERAEAANDAAHEEMMRLEARAEHAEAALARVRAIPERDDERNVAALHRTKGWNACRAAVLAALDGDT